MSERDDKHPTWVYLFLVALALLVAVIAMTAEYRGQLRDLQRRVATLESERR